MNRRLLGAILLGLVLMVGLAYFVGLMILASPPPPLPPAPIPTSATLQPTSASKLPLGGSFNVQEGKLIYEVSPSYPELAREMRWVPPFVRMELTVAEDGSVADTKIVRGHPLCDDAAVAAVRQWRYTPTLVNGTPVPVLLRTSLRCGDPYHGKLAPEIALLIDRVRTGTVIDANEFPFVRRGMANLEVTVSEPPQKNVEKLKTLGFLMTESHAGATRFIGYLPIADLDSLRGLPYVRFISPQAR